MSVNWSCIRIKGEVPYELNWLKHLLNNNVSTDGPI